MGRANTNFVTFPVAACRLLAPTLFVALPPSG
jgi:hypothetical protein